MFNEKRHALQIVCILTVIWTTACSNATGSLNTHKDLIQPYLLAINELIATDADQQHIAEHLQNEQKVDILSLSREQLMDQGFAESNTAKLKGILLEVERQEFLEGDNLSIDATKYRANGS